jgi:hypothetical protein
MGFQIIWRCFQHPCHGPTSNRKMTDELWIGKDSEGNGRRLIEVLYEHLPGGYEENDEKPVRHTVMCSICFNITFCPLNAFISHQSQDEQRLYPQTTLADWPLFSVRLELNCYSGCQVLREYHRSCESEQIVLLQFILPRGKKWNEKSSL